MGPEIDVRERLEAKMDASTYTADYFFAQELEDELMKFTITYEASKADTHLVKQNEEVQRNVEAEVNITELTKASGHNLIEAECQETTESSSSFSGSGSEVENVDTLHDSEALSEFRADVGSDGFGEIFRTRKKKPTTHWRLFIQPLMWRCKWIELQIKKFQSQAKKYERQLEEFSRQKHIQLENSTLENIGAKSIPLSWKTAKRQAFRRKKRKKAEATIDVAAYMSRHKLFSYHENRNTECASMQDEFKNPAIATREADADDELWVNDESLCLEPGAGDHSFENILQKIEFLQSQVVKLKSRADEVISENSRQLSFPDNVSVPMTSNALIGSENTDFAYDGDRIPVGNYIASQLISEYNKGYVLEPKGAVTNHGMFVPDENGIRDLACYTDALANVEDEVLIDNQRVKEEMDCFEVVKIQPIQSPLVLKDGLGSNVPVLTEPDLVTEDQPPPKIRSIAKLTAPTSKRKTGKRKGAW